MSLPQLDFLRFNPTLVRLRLWIPDVGVMGTIVFQSHAGSIEARCGFLTSGLWEQSCFNPTLVRLRLRSTSVSGS